MNTFCRLFFLLILSVFLCNCHSLRQQQQDKGSELIQACKKGDARRAEQLLHQGADANAIGIGGETPLGAALICLNKGRWKRHAEGCVRILLHANANPNQPYRHTTPIHLAVGTGKVEIAELLIRNGADPNAETAGSLAPIWWTAYQNHAPMAEMLLRHGANPNARDTLGRTPLQFLQEQGHQRTRVMQYLRQYGGK